LFPTAGTCRYSHGPGGGASQKSEETRVKVETLSPPVLGKETLVCGDFLAAV